MKKEYLEPKATLLELLTGDIMNFSANFFVDADEYQDGQEFNTDRNSFSSLFGSK